MAKKQTRRSVSLNRDVFAAVQREAAKRKQSMAHYVETVLRTQLELPATHHMTLDAVAKAVLGRKRTAARAALPIAVYGPSPAQVSQLRTEVVAGMRKPNANSTLAEQQARGRQVSRVFAKELRRKGWLAADREGYAPNSWAKDR